jgi:sugar O-acyltransferase (sialic acid O-acetyltransferase NeuD family)
MRSGLELIVVGAGGHAKVVISALRASGWKIRAIYDDDESKWSQTFDGVPIVGPTEKLSEPDGLPAIIAVGDVHFRRNVANRYSRDWATAIHPRSFVDPSVKIGPGTVIFAGAVIQAQVTIGEHAIINTSSSVDHDCVIGDFAHVGPGAHLAANVKLETGAFLGTGSQVIPGTRVGSFSMVGAGSTVIRDVPPDVTAVGCPARIIKNMES